MRRATRRVIIFAPLGDAHLRFVQPHLAEEPLILGPTQAAVTIHTSDLVNWPQVYYGENLIGLQSSVWLRQMPSDPLARHVMFSLPDAYWLSDWAATMRAQALPYQLMVAQQVGFQIPQTTITPAETEACDFLSEHGVCVRRTLGAESAPPQLLRVSANPDLTGISATQPWILQTMVPASHEVHVTVVGSRVFAASVANLDPDALIHPEPRDWRQGLATGTVDVAEKLLSETVAMRCTELVRRMGLRMAVIHLLVRKGDHEHIFLRLDPTGDWHFIEGKTRLPIGAAVAAELRRNVL